MWHHLSRGSPVPPPTMGDSQGHSSEAGLGQHRGFSEQEHESPLSGRLKASFSKWEFPAKDPALLKYSNMCLFYYPELKRDKSFSLFIWPFYQQLQVC